MSSYTLASMQRMKTAVVRNSVNVAPCKDCADRVVGCHSSCQNYIDWKNMVSDKTREFNDSYKKQYCGSVDEQRRYFINTVCCRCDKTPYGKRLREAKKGL